ncbi:MAG: NAD(P)H-binding protein [Pseudomonadota bacterium]
MVLLIAGATGLVGRHALTLALADPRIDRVVAPTRRALPPHPKLENPVVDFEALPADAAWWSVDAVVCALGTTIRDAGSQAAFRRVDVDYVIAVATHARSAGARAFALNSSLGADPASRGFYLRCKGDAEAALRSLAYPSLTLVRPSIIGGERERRRPLEHLGMVVLRALAPMVPRRYRVVPAERIARRLVDAALDARSGEWAIESEAI